jgi:Rod binding domain-containing protein
MRRTVPELSESSSARDLYHELHDEMLATPLARNGGIGLAAMIRAYLDWSPTPGAGSHTAGVGEKK